MREIKVSFSIRKAITTVMALYSIICPTRLSAQTEAQGSLAERHEMTADRADSLIVNQLRKKGVRFSQQLRNLTYNRKGKV